MPKVTLGKPTSNVLRFERIGKTQISKLKDDELSKKIMETKSLIYSIDKNPENYKGCNIPESRFKLCEFLSDLYTESDGRKWGKFRRAV